MCNSPLTFVSMCDDPVELFCCIFSIAIHLLLALIECASWFAFPKAVIIVIAGLCFGKMGKA